MGHKDGAKIAGGRGKQSVLPVLSMDALSKAQDGEFVDIKDLARKHVEMSIDTLARAQRHKLSKSQLARGEELAPWTVRVKAAKDVLEIAGGRPETRETERSSGGLTVIINKISTGEQMETVVSEVRMARELAADIDRYVPEE